LLVGRVCPYPADGETGGLLALMLLTDARHLTLRAGALTASEH
jgi:hypothetical protein